MVDSGEEIAELEAKLVLRDARIAEQDAQITLLTQQVAELLEQVAFLTEKLGQNSSNSHKPPSSDAPGNGTKSGTNLQREKNRRKKSKRKRGGQRGHQGNHRSLLPPSQVDEFIDFFPPECESCWSPLPQIQEAWDRHSSRCFRTERGPACAACSPPPVKRLIEGLDRRRVTGRNNLPDGF